MHLLHCHSLLVSMTESHVRYETAIAFELEGAVRALVRSALARVSFEVPLQMFLARCLVGALVTGVRTLPAVDEVMPADLVCVVGGVGTLGTFEHPILGSVSVLE